MGARRYGAWHRAKASRWAALASLLASTASAFEFYPPFLPDHIAANETITHIELRLFLDGSEPGSQVRVTPTSDAIQFTPRDLVFSGVSAATQTLTMVAREPGLAKIQFLGQVESIDNGTVIVTQNATEIGADEIDVLQPPLAYAIDDARWHGVILLNDSFDGDGFSVTKSPLWGKISHGYPSGSCGARDGSKALYFTALGDRFAMTKPLSLLGFDGKLHFHQLYGYRSGQDYDDTGDNRVSCEMVDNGEEIVLSYLPANQAENNASAWLNLLEANLSARNAGNFTSYSVVLPTAAMHSQARLRWQQKAHSSFPVDPISGLSLAAVVAGENDNTSVNGELGISERELWKFRNLFDQWALDDVRLEVRLTPPFFQNADDKTIQITTISTDTGILNVSIGHALVLVDSPVLNTWTEYNVGDGTQDFPTCDPVNAAKANTAQAVHMDESGYIHAITCLVATSVTSTVISSFPARSQRILVKARAPTITTTLDTTTDVDTWTVALACDGCSFMRYTTYSAPTITVSVEPDTVQDESHVAPSCSFGTLVDASSGSFHINSNSQVFAIACGEALLPSDVTQSSKLNVAPRAPTFAFTYTATTITNEFDVTIFPPADEAVGIAYTVGEANSEVPICPLPEVVVPGSILVTVRASDVIRAVSCCASAQCVDSEVASWGPISVQAVAPISSMACSRMKPLTMVLQVAPVTTNAWIQYQVGKPSRPLNCVETEKAPFLYHGDIEVANTSTSVFAVSCLHGLQPSDQVEIPVVVDQCCAGINSFQYPTCAHVLLLHDNFATCLDVAKWTKLTTQWGGQDVNGGVHADNVRCVRDDVRAKNVLRLSANGDLFPGTVPVGNKRIDDDGSLQPRTIDDMFLEWALEGVSPTPCNELARCPARRVGAAIQTAALEENAGVMLIRLKPCANFGTLTQIWWGDYTKREDETMQEVSFLPLWKAGLYQAKTTSEVSFVLSSPSNMPLQDSQVREPDFLELVMQWDASIGRTNLYVNGKLVHKQVLSSNAPALSLTKEPLSLGVWFPNAVAGEPLFSTCDVIVDEVHVFKAEVTGERWCDFESVNQSAVPCSANSDCQDWVYRNCLMPIHEAVCVAHRNETLKQPTMYAPDGSVEDQDVLAELELGVTDSEGEDNARPATQFYCQFRLHSTTSQADPTDALRSTTELTQRQALLRLPTEEGSAEPEEIPLDDEVNEEI